MLVPILSLLSCKFLFLKCILLTYSWFIMLISAVQKSDSYVYIFHIYIYIYTFFFVFSIILYNFLLFSITVLSQDIECSSLFYTVELAYLFYIWLLTSAHPKLPIHSSPTPCPTWQPWICSPCLWVCFCFTISFVSYFRFKYEWYHMIFVFLFLIYFT